MRFVPTAPVLATCLFLFPVVVSAEQPHPGASAPALEAAPGTGDDLPPFMRPHVVKPVPHGPDRTFARKPGPAGFHGLAWGVSLAEARAGARLVPISGLKHAFMRTGETLKLGAADLRNVAYYFPDDRLAGVGVTFAGDANFFLVKEYLIREYGPGRQVGARYGWTWKDRDIELRQRNGVGELRYTYEP